MTLAWMNYRARLLIGGIGLLLGSVCGPPAMASQCADLLPGLRQDVARAVTAGDIAKLRDIGPIGGMPAGQSPLALSPDGRSIAFILTRAHPETNSYCQGLVVVDLRPDSVARLVDQGGELIRVTFQSEQRGLLTDTGIAAINQPRWSPDGSQIAYLRKDGGRTQAWRASVHGKSGAQVSHSPVDVEAVAWSDDGRALIYANRPSLIEENAKLDRESLTGYLFDDRAMPIYGDRPMIRGPLPLHYAAADISSTSSSDRAATPAERTALDRIGPGMLLGGPLAITGPSGEEGWVKAEVPDRYLSPIRLWGKDREGREWQCQHSSCTDGIIGMWWSAKHGAVRYLRRDGYGGSRLTFYLWTPGHAAPRKMWGTDGLLTGCLPLEDHLICAQEGSTQPRRIVALDADTGRSSVVFDPNPEFQYLQMGKVQRLYWKNPLGFETFGDLVLPANYPVGAKLPMIVVQYRTRGFLRGSIGDEYPIHAFAAQGFAVLSVESPPFFATSLKQGNWRTWKDAESENVKGWRERHNGASSIVAGVETAMATGVIDPKRIGLTGLSDGSTTAWYLLINTDLFAATSVSTCCADPKTDLIMGGPAWEKERRRFGYPAPTNDNPAFWKPISPAMNAARIKGPVLMQLASDEYLRALEAYTAFREIGPPVEMFLFPGDHHIKWQPAHRMAIYARNIDWFNFWLRDAVDPAPEKAAQYDRWRRLKSQLRP
ncbi:Atxe2 family lasso peptide isopeptidase [Sphingobium sp. CR2-8]|uniref:Atxe2 family lasso peptide isopeptidase n=1 Tax=Sphingobium sp. CR2-8 TaxID=1306534 RepID=UPI002DBBA3AD|nr:Atxe2 family lasso peptide isopeptidase [Sphingobium sp. CR2-8]MEC3909676.1 Atxe2 family lasso peptide isopeptidase [Sphingobium sp. CR2-8]